MTTTTFDGPAIVVGYEYRLQIETDAALFPIGATLAAQMRDKVSSATPVAELTTADGSMARVSDFIVELIVPATATALFAPGNVVVDLIRTDQTPQQHLNFSLEITVVMPVTRGV